jgi:PRTRC genetic system protein D
MVPSGKVHKKIQAAGIDVGFFSTKFTLGERLGPSGTEIVVDQFPSVAAELDGPDLPTHGSSSSDDQAVAVSVNGGNFGVGKSVMSYLGMDGLVRTSNTDYCKSPAYSAFMLGAFFFMAKSSGCTGDLVIENLTVGLPVNTIKVHQGYLKMLALGEHIIPSPSNISTPMKVIVQSVNVVAQPQGAIVNLTSRISRKVKKKDQCLVLDMGGGTFDWFVCDGSLKPTYPKCGATNIGALACVNRVCRSISPGCEEDATTVDKIDTALRMGDPTVSINGTEYQMSKYWPVVDLTLQKAITQMKNQVGTFVNLDHILITGGGATILERVFLRSYPELAKITIVDEDPVYSNVKGFLHISNIVSMHAK